MDVGIDQLNTLSYEQYFGEMDLTESEKKERIKLAEELEIIFLYYFLLLHENQQKDYMRIIRDKYIEVANKFLKVKKMPAYILSYSAMLARKTVDVTNRHPKDEYYTSKDRAMIISANESNVLGNYRQQIDAVKSGKRYKTWLTMRDDKVRHSHMVLNNKKIGIFDTFNVGGYEMSFPKDESFGASQEEIANCRCVLRYE